MLSLLALGLYAVLLYCLLCLFSFVKHLRAARATGLPYVCLPIFELNPVWQISKPFHRAIISSLPFGLSRSQWLELWFMDWRFVAKHDIHKRLGDVFLVVTPGCLMVEIASAPVAADVVNRSRTDFIKPVWLYSPVNIFGINVITAEGHTWKRHRKVVAPQYNDAIHRHVWHEALNLAQAMVARWTSASKLAENGRVTASSSYSVENISPDLTSLALRVIAAAGFGVSVPFEMAPRSSETPLEVPHMEDSLDPRRVARFPRSLEYMINNFIKLLVIPGWMLRLGPSSWRVLHASFNDVGDLLKEIMDTQIRKQTLRKDGYQSQVTQKSILGELVRSGGMVIGDADDKPDKEQRNEVIATMSREEVLGNTFILALAGSRTTADSLLYSFVLLAMHPNVQKWLHEEIDNALAAEDEDPAQWRYETLFPKLIAPLCVMMETLRVYPSAVAIPKWTGEASHNIMIEGQPYLIPSRTMVNLSLNGLQFNPKYWGPAPRTYRPQNWDTRCECHWNSNGADEKSNKVIDNFSTPPTTPFVTIRTPLEGSYMPFSDGARGCLGKRFSQVEFAAVMTVVLRNHTVELGVGAGETVEAVRQRTSDILEGSLSHLTLSMQKQVPLRFVERQQRATLRGARSS